MLHPFSIVYQITQMCPLECDICLRYYNAESRRLSRAERLLMVDTLCEQGLFRLNVTGGEPTLLGKELIDFISYVHSRKVHTCLTTTGIFLSKEQLSILDGCLDQLLMSIRGCNLSEWEQSFGKTKATKKSFEKAFQILEWVQSTGIILEVATVLHKKNRESIFEIGNFLRNINPGIVWRVDEYYGIGLKSQNRETFEIEDEEFDLVKARIVKEFSGSFKALRFLSKSQRVHSPEYLITQSGDLVNSSDNTHQETGLNVVKQVLPNKFVSLRNIEDLKPVCRDWGWADFENKHS